VTLFGIAAALVALAFAAFQARDLYAPLAGRRAEPRVVRTPSANPLLRVPVLSALYEQRAGLFVWVAGTALIAGFMLSLTRSMNDLLINNPTFRLYLGAGGTSDPTLITLGLFWFGIAALIVVIFAVFQVGRWAADDAEGRLEMTVAQPVARWRVVAERFLVLAAGAALLAAAGSAVIAATAPGQGIHLDGGRFLLATVLLVPLALTFGALGAALTARVPRLAVPVLATLAVIGYFIPQVAPLFRWPDWALDLSFFRLYGSPLTQGVFWTGLWAMAAVTVVGFGVGLGAMRYREIGR
jgi:putative exporter of polyketide antibiotics